MKVNKDDISQVLHRLYEIVGEEKFLEICKSYGGVSIYISVHGMVMMAGKNRDICRRFDGRNFKVLAVEYGISEQQVRRILKL